MFKNILIINKILRKDNNSNIQADECIRGALES